MRKSNWIIVGILVVASIIFLCTYFMLGFNLVDDMFDLGVTIAWWVVIVAVCLLIHFAEKRRQRMLRTTFVAPGVIYNSEAGLVKLQPDESYVAALQKVLDHLDYHLGEKKAQNDKRIRFQYIVHTDRFAGDGAIWQGEVVNVSKLNDPPTPYHSKRELASILDAA